MADKTEKEKQHALDSYELGSVESVNDLAPDNKVGASRVTKATDRIDRGKGTGYFESEAVGLGAPLHIGPELRKDAGPALDRYVDAYSIYAVPLRSMLGSMGRLKDVSQTGAPMTPEELMKRPDLAARFANLTSQSSTSVQESAAAHWSYTQQKLRVDTENFTAVQTNVAAAVANYRRVQARLEGRRVKAQRDADQKQLHEIEEAAETLARIVDVTVEAAGSVGEFGELLDAKVGLDESAEGLESYENLPKNGNTNYEFGTIHDATGENTQTKSKAKRAGDAMSNAGETGSMAAKLAKQTKAQVAKVGKIDMSLQGVFIGLMEPAKYTQLQKDIARLDGKIKSLALKEEEQDLIAAEGLLSAATLQLKATRHEIQVDRVAARTGARAYGTSVGEGHGDASPTRMAMYAAEAYHELAAFGAQAKLQRTKTVMPRWTPVFHYMNETHVERFVALNVVDDARALATNLQAVREQGTFFDEHIPDWQKNAEAWSRFLGNHSPSELDSGEK
ncbi:MAG: hypothetical protein ABJE66_26315 [Deltaproteobacteria bacterium]